MSESIFTERWLPVPGYHGLYEVSDLGNVKTLRRGRLLTPHPDGKGYPVVKLYDGRGGVKTAKVHLLVLLAFVGPPLCGCQANHRDGNKRNAKVENLEYVTGKENVRHAWQHGLSSPNRGERHGGCKVTEATARLILAMRGQRSQRSLAKEFGISQTEVWMIQSGRNWSHL